ncbi:universal stress protein PHOS32, partial [Fagus crenata]
IKREIGTLKLLKHPNVVGLHEKECLWPPYRLALVPVSEFSDPIIMKKYGVKPDHETLDIVNTAARWEQIVAVKKIHWGDPREKICEAIDNIPLSCLIIGNRGLGRLKR